MLTLAYAFGFIGAGLMVASYLMHSMLPLRVVALAANLFLVIYAAMNGSYPTLALYLAMIPINLKKVYEIPEGSRTSKGRSIVNFVGIDTSEKEGAERESRAGSERCLHRC
mgnify:CR=1 FL=1